MRLTTCRSRATAPRRATPGLVAIASLAALLLAASPVHAAPSKWLLSSTVGHDVNKTKTEAGAPQEERNQCTVASRDECQLGVEGGGPRDFHYSEGIATSKINGDVYVADRANNRVQVLGSDGSFLFMFGWKVDKTTGGNVCTAASGDECGPGEAGSGLAQQLGSGSSIAVDPSSGNVFVLDHVYHRVDEYTAGGEFVLMLGGKVNKNGTNVCRAAEESECQAGQKGTGPGEFDELGSGGNVLTIGVEDHLLYVGDSCPASLEECKSVATRARVQRFEANGTWVGQTSLDALSEEGLVTAVAVNTPGEMFVTDSAVKGVHEVSLAGQPQTCVIDPGGEGHAITGIAFDAYGRLGVLEHEFINQNVSESHGTLYQVEGAQCGAAVGGEIAPPSGEMAYGSFEGAFYHSKPEALSFSEDESGSDLDRLYVVSTNGFFNELEIYDPILFPEARTCAPTEVMATSATLCGEVNPNSIETKAFFKYGPAGGALASQTPVALTGTGEAFEAFTYELTGLTPNQLYGYETWVQAESEGTLATAGGPPAASFHTSTPPPEVPGAPEVSFLTASSAVLSATLNPEHAQTSYRFQYAACPGEGLSFAQCGAVQSSQAQESAQYGAVTAIQGVSGLQPRTAYVYRLVAANGFEYEGSPEGGVTQGAEGHFTTSASAAPTAQTGGASGVGANTAVVSGYVNPDGAAATYAFELGVDEGAATQYGVVASGSAGAGVGAVQEAAALAGLQPGTAYSYRIRIDSGYGHVLGAVASFTTQGVPQLLQAPSALPLLPTPAISFPKHAGKPAAGKCKKGHARNRHGKCVKHKSKQRKGLRARKAGKGRNAHKSSHRPAGGGRH